MNIFKRKKNIPNPQRNLFPIIIGGCYRTGTTLLRRIIDSHSNINCPPEVKFFRDLYGEYFNDELSHLRFFKTAEQIGLSHSELLNIFGKAFVECHIAAAKKSRKRRWADKNPENVLYLNDWQKILNKKFYFILMVRNPLDTLASLKEANFVKTLPAEFDALVEVYLNYTNSGLNYVKSHKDSSIIIQYENLVSNPVSTIKEIMSFAGEKYEHQMLNSFNNKKRKSGIEDPKIMQTNSIHSNSLGRGKTDLSKSEIEYISEKCEKIFRKFNYELP